MHRMDHSRGATRPYPIKIGKNTTEIADAESDETTVESEIDTDGDSDVFESGGVSLPQCSAEAHAVELRLISSSQH